MSVLLQSVKVTPCLQAGVRLVRFPLPVVDRCLFLISCALVREENVSRSYVFFGWGRFS